MINPFDVATGVARSALRSADALRPRFRGATSTTATPTSCASCCRGMWLLVTTWYRPVIRGIERVPRRGPVLVVGNHTGGVTSPEITISQLAFSLYFGVERPHYQLAHRMVLNSPIGWIAAALRHGRGGPGERRAGARRRRDGDGLPGGDHEVFRPSWESAKVDFGGRKGFLRLALRKDVPIVPMVTIGGQETALFLSRGERLARLDRRRPHACA